MRDPAWLASHTQYGGVQNDPPKIRIGMQVLNTVGLGLYSVGYNAVADNAGLCSFILHLLFPKSSPKNPPKFSENSNL